MPVGLFTDGKTIASDESSVCVPVGGVVGEFEKTTGPAVSGDITGRTVVVAQGPAANRRLGGLVGDNVAVPASGSLALENLLPSDAVTPSEPWRLQAQMHLRGGRSFEYFLSPAVGEGLNPGLRVTGGETTPLGQIFQMQAGWIAGRVELVGRPETAATKSALRGVQGPDDAGVDAFGIPAGAAAPLTVVPGERVAADVRLGDV